MKKNLVLNEGVVGKEFSHLYEWYQYLFFSFMNDFNFKKCNNHFLYFIVIRSKLEWTLRSENTCNKNIKWLEIGQIKKAGMKEFTII